MIPAESLRLWPARNFLAEIEPAERSLYALEDLAVREPRLRRAYRKVQTLGRALQERVGRSEWTRFTDTRTFFQSALFELAFNLGFENGLIKVQAEVLRERKPTGAERRFGEELRQIVARAPVSAERAMLTVLELAYALATSQWDPAGVNPGHQV
jgi:hypothetical protein